MTSPLSSPARWLAILLLASQPALARTWTNTEGRTIEAEFVSATGDTVTLNLAGKEIPYPLAKLSQADRDWVAKHLAAEQAAQEERLAALRGRREGVPIDTRFFEQPSAYFDEGTRASWITAFEEGAYETTGTFDQWLARDPGKDRCLIYCPPSYDGTEAYGLYLHIHPGNGASLKPEWEPLFDAYKLIAVSAEGVGNFVDGDRKRATPMPRRVSLSLDALAVVERDYQIDPRRRVVGGLSGGGHMAFTIAALYPELFQGAISSAAQSYLPGHFPGLRLSDFTEGPRHALKWVVVSGEKDRNYQEILETSKVWDRNKMQYRFIDVPGMGHTAYARKDFEEALRWIGLAPGPGAAQPTQVESP